MNQPKDPQQNHNPPFLGGLSPQAFLSQHWQKKPLFVRNGFPEWQHCITPDELAGYALEECVESRILIEKGENEWELRHGPFQETAFTGLPKNKWTLLIQAIDHYVPEFALLLDAFEFLPQWRIDDLMMSYAATGGSVGPHYDYYDVFLIQISGRRHWQIGQQCNDQSSLIGGLPVRILETFDATEDWVVNPGDVLYLPPGVAHHGVALDDDCMTLSVGFRAPSYADLISEYSHHVAARLTGANRYEDKDLAARTPERTHAGRLSSQDIHRVASHLNHLLNDPTTLTRWLAGYLSLPKYEAVAPQRSELSATEIHQLMLEGHGIQRDENSRFIWVETIDAPLYINGGHFTFPPSARELSEFISCKRRFEAPALLNRAQDEAALQWLIDLIQQGLLYFYDI